MSGYCACPCPRCGCRDLQEAARDTRLDLIHVFYFAAFNLSPRWLAGWLLSGCSAWTSTGWRGRKKGTARHSLTKQKHALLRDPPSTITTTTHHHHNHTPHRQHHDNSGQRRGTSAHLPRRDQRRGFFLLRDPITGRDLVAVSHSPPSSCPLPQVFPAHRGAKTSPPWRPSASTLTMRSSTTCPTPCRYRLRRPTALSATAKMIPRASPTPSSTPS